MRGGVADFVKLCLSNRCKQEKTITDLCKYINDYVDFNTEKHPELPLTGDGASVAVSKWPIHLKSRGQSVPKKGRYALKVFAEALGIISPCEHPGAKAATRVQKTKTDKHAPPIPFKLLKDVEALCSDPDQPHGSELFASLLCLQVFASLRHADTVHASELCCSETALIGKSINTQSKGWNIMTWATPLKGTLNSDWATPILDHWSLVAPATGECVALFPYFEKDRSVDFAKKKHGWYGSSGIGPTRKRTRIPSKIKNPFGQVFAPHLRAADFVYPGGKGEIR